MQSSQRLFMVVLWSILGLFGLEFTPLTGATPETGKAAAPSGKADRYGDPLPPGALARLGTVRWRHGDKVSFVAFLPDGKLLLTASADRLIRLWNLETGQETRRLEKKYQATYLSPNGKILAYTSNGTLYLVDLATGKDLQQLKPSHNGDFSVAFAPNSKRLATKGNDQTTRLWDVESGKEIRQFKAKQNEKNMLWISFGSNGSTVAFSPDGKTLAVTDSEYENNNISSCLRLWDVESGKEVHRIKTQQFDASSPTFSPDGKFLAFTNGTGISLYEAGTGKEVRQFKGHEGGAGAIAFSPDSKTLASKGATNLGIRLWEVSSGNLQRHLAETAAPASGGANVFFSSKYSAAYALAFSTDGKILASGGAQGTVRLWEVATGKEHAPFNGHRGAVSAAAFLPGSKTVISQSGDQTVRHWAADSGKERHQCSLPEGSTCAALSSDGRTLAVGSGDNSIRLLESATGRELRKLAGHDKGVAIVAFSPDNTCVISRGSMDNSLRVWDAATGREIRQILIPLENQDDGGVNGVIKGGGVRGGQINLPCLGLVMSQDNNIIVSPGSGNSLRVWEVSSGKQVRLLAFGDKSSVASFALSPNGKTLACENTDQTVSLWELGTGKECVRLGKPVNAVVEKQDHGQMGFVVLRNVSAGIQMSEPSNTVAFSGDGRTLAVRSGMKEVRLWDILTGKECGHLKGHQGKIETIVFAPDGQTLVTGSSDTSLLVWDLKSLLPVR